MTDPFNLLYLALGDSITAGYPNLAGWAAQTVPSPPSPAMQAIPGWMAGDASNLMWGNSSPNPVLPPPIIPTTLMTLLGTNDSFVYGLDVERQPIYARCMRALLARGAMPNYIATRSPQCSKSSGWSNTSVNQIGVFTTANGASLTTTVEGTSIYIGGLVFNYPYGHGTTDVYIDNIKMGTISTFGRVDTTTQVNAGHGYYWCAACDRFDGLRPCLHTVTIVVTSPNGQLFYLDWIAGNSQSFSSRLLIGNLPGVLASGYQIDAYNATLAQLVNEFCIDGFNAHIVDVHSVIDPNTMLQVDGVHPTQQGQNAIAHAFWQSLMT